ncbi:hypothetical protein BDW22DRAFT_1430700 [Trametopsis cervina]|nr:hypothetical protein BDW22DRAFT_1430700 [Trametopsis cervina]
MLNPDPVRFSESGEALPPNWQPPLPAPAPIEGVERHRPAPTANITGTKRSERLKEPSNTKARKTAQNSNAPVLEIDDTRAQPGELKVAIRRSRRLRSQDPPQQSASGKEKEATRILLPPIQQNISTTPPTTPLTSISPTVHGPSEFLDGGHIHNGVDGIVTETDTEDEYRHGEVAEADGTTPKGDRRVAGLDGTVTTVDPALTVEGSRMVSERNNGMEVDSAESSQHSTQASSEDESSSAFGSQDDQYMTDGSNTPQQASLIFFFFTDDS